MLVIVNRWFCHAMLVALVVCVPSGARADEGCGWRHHFNQLAGNPAQNCLGGYTISRERREEIEPVKRNRRQIDQLNMPALCVYPISCSQPLDRRVKRVEQVTEHTLKVTGTASVSAKVSLSDKLLDLLGLDVEVSVSVSGSVSYTYRVASEDTYEVFQTDCHNKEFKHFRNTERVRGKVTEVEVYEWRLHPVGWSDGEIWHPCSGGTVRTTCDLGSASGSAYTLQYTEIVDRIWPCCSPLIVSPPDTPCCGRVCPQ